MNDNNGDSFSESNTYRNLQDAFNGEATASTKYAIYGMKAKEEGFEQIGNIYEETSRNEREHAEIWFKLLHDGIIPATPDNLKDSYGGENFEWSNMYIGYAQEAVKEGYPQIARLFEGVAAIERHHDARFRRLYQNIMYDKVFCKDNKAIWICLNCGNLFYGECAPDPCPICGYPQGYYQLNCENY